MVKAFVKQFCKLGDGLFIKKSELYAAYLKVCEDNYVKPVSNRMFGIYMTSVYKLSSNNFTSDGSSRAWWGIDLIDGPVKDYKVWPQI